jgi:hypothetical protein
MIDLARTRPWWQQLATISVALPLAVLLAVVAFAWPAARISPRDLPLGIVGTSAASQSAVAGLQRAHPGAFELKLYADEGLARRAIQHRQVYGALSPSPAGITVLTASAASPIVAQLLSQLGRNLSDQARTSTGSSLPVTTVDVVTSSAKDPRGLVISAALLPLTICSIIIAAVIALGSGLRPAWRQLVALIAVSALAGLGAFLIAQGFLGALPHQGAGTWAGLALTVLAMSASAAGLIALTGPAGLGLGALVMVFVGNPFSGVTSAPELLPKPVGTIGQWLPPGAGANLLRSTSYFGGNAAGFHLAVLVLWTILGLAAVVAGQHSFVGYSARAARHGEMA